MNVVEAMAHVRPDENGHVHLVGLSGGKDSTALALRLRELYPDRPFAFFCTPTGDELPEMKAHWWDLENRLGQPLLRLTATYRGRQLTLDTLIEIFKALPNNRQRWCTRMLKIEPAQAFMRGLAATGRPATMYVGLRADEPERQGLYGEGLDVVFPMREWGWGVADVWAYLAKQGVTIPRRTDCARCYHQRLVEWKVLSEEHPDIYEEAVAQEDETGRTFRNPKRDTWPAGLRELREQFRSGRKVRGEKAYRDRVANGESPCRVCSL